MTLQPLKVLVDEWLRLDQNQATRSEVQRLWEEGQTEELERRMRYRIEFGTAGLRGRMEAGWSRMNDLIVIQASQGLCAYVLSNVSSAAEKGVVVGHDHRYNSERWALLTAAAFISSGVKVYLHRGLVHTPLVPFSVKRLGAACGVMITASHNPKDDNGYKVYWENAVQIIAPHDKGIAAAIETNLEPKSWDTAQITMHNLCLDYTKSMTDAYFQSLLLSIPKPAPYDTSALRFVNTSMHGVSHPFVSRAFAEFGLPEFVPVIEQMNPDPDFPTVSFPNPEEKGALDLAIKTGEGSSATYVLAQDPDSDRFSASERRPDGTWFTFTGDQLGAIFASQASETYRASGKSLDKLAMVASTVSSKMVESMAYTEKFKFVECLTGFKFIGNTALDLVKAGYEVPFGYEEAIGYMFGNELRDKDGVAATMSFVSLATALHAHGQSVYWYLQSLYEKYGYFKTSNSYFICRDPLIIDAIFSRLRNFDGQGVSSIEAKPSNIQSLEAYLRYPRAIAGMNVTRIVDLTTGYDSANAPSFQPSLPISSGHMIQFRAQSKDADEDRVSVVFTLRTSGTEPKIKYYLEGSGKDATRVNALIPKVVEELGNVWFEAEKNHLGKP